MNSKLRLTLLLLVSFPLLALSAEQMRLFTDAKGRSLRATFVSVQNGQVTLRLENGQQHVLNISTLSAADQQWIRSQGAAAPAANLAPAATSNPSEHGGMVLAPNWIPDRLETKRELLESLQMYASAVVGNAARGKEPVPGTIVAPIRWLMPFDEAVRVLPERMNKIGERPVSLTCFPQASLTLASFQFKSFIDKEQPFNLLHLILDLKRQVVGVQFVEQTPDPGKVRWFPVPDGAREPYYNFLTLTNNGSGAQEVAYQIVDAGSGVKLIKTVLQTNTGLGAISRMAKMPNMPGMPMMPGGAMGGVKCKENVHLYLAAPLARCLLDIVDRSLRKPTSLR